MNIEDLKNIYKGRTALIISGGPSREKWKKIYESLNSPIIICVKNTILEESLNTICDLHFFNNFNIKMYKYKNPKTIKIFTDEIDAPKIFHKNIDITFRIQKIEDSNLVHSLAYKLNFDDFLIEKSGIIRPWGPGIMYETVIYSLLYMGINDIHTIGWDIADHNGKNSKNKFTTENYKIILLKNFISHYIPKNIKHMLGMTYNRAETLPNEALTVSRSIKHFKIWLLNKGVKLNINSDSVWMKKTL